MNILFRLTSAALLATALAGTQMVPSGTMAQDRTKAMAKGADDRPSAAKDRMAGDRMAKDPMGKDPMAKDPMAKDQMAKDGTRR